ncbi:hypothetical protein RRG08_012179 [Elysia crispata]|uniref:Uncharacterized protein n=1 Tax=Elysia crispata TaxID=231223 RepID=A0AAE0ZJ67_9GAST|nr:hypothetical protein RRG08_012179 [Elysia crispata]
MTRTVVNPVRKRNPIGRNDSPVARNLKKEIQHVVPGTVYNTPRHFRQLGPTKPEVSHDVDSWSQWNDDSTSVVGANAPEEPGPSSAVPQLNAQRKAEKRKSLAKESRIDSEIVRALQEPPVTDIERFLKKSDTHGFRLDDLTKMEIHRDVQDMVIRHARRQRNSAGHYFENNYEQQNSVDLYISSQ